MPVRILKAPEHKIFSSIPDGTSAVTAWTNPYFGQFKFRTIRAVNVSALDADVSIFHDPAGSTYGDATALESTKTLTPGESMWITDEVAGYLQGETIGVQTSVADAINFTGYGVIDDLEVSP